MKSNHADEALAKDVTDAADRLHSAIERATQAGLCVLVDVATTDIIGIDEIHYHNTIHVAVTRPVGNRGAFVHGGRVVIYTPKG